MVSASVAPADSAQNCLPLSVYMFSSSVPRRRWNADVKSKSKAQGDTEAHRARPLQERRGPAFNPNLMFLKPPCNSAELRYSHWGGTNYGEVKDRRQRRGVGSSP